MNFACPHCGSPQIATQDASANFGTYAYVGPFRELVDREEADRLRIGGSAVRCANQECNRISVAISLESGKNISGTLMPVKDSDFLTTRLYPPRSGKPFPVGVPEEMLEDYNEAWSIIDLSPKSSATLARRCLQAMIRNFCGIRERTLYHEIEALEKRLKEDTLPKGVEPETVAAMKVLKDMGNIGAHMTEIDGVIVDVDQDEAARLLGLIEMLFSDWYVARHKRQQQLAAIEAMAVPQP